MPDLHLPSFIAGALLDPKKCLVCGRRWGKAAAAVEALGRPQQARGS